LAIPCHFDNDGHLRDLNAGQRFNYTSDRKLA
jgi:hypothetical protein